MAQKIKQRVHINLFKGFTLLELIIVIVAIVVLLGVGLPIYNRVAENARDKIAISTLMAIQVGEKVYQLKTDFYYPYTTGATVTNVDDINSYLKLELNRDYTDDPTLPWDYYINYYVADDFEAYAEREGSDYRVWYINKDMDEPGTPP